VKSWAFVPSDQAAYQAAKDRLPYKLNEKGAALESYYPLLGEVGAALDQGQFQMVYQPQIDLAKYVTKGFEALVRWNHPSRGTLSPGIFLPLLEETQLIHPLGEWVLHAVLRQLRQYRMKGFPVTVSINVSAKQFYHPTFIAHVAETIDLFGLPRDALKIEIAEATLMLDPEKSVELLEKADRENLSIWMDNFGRGQSSLIHLPKLKLEGIKLAPEFWEKLNVDLTGGPVVELAVELARRLNLKIIAESVESARTAAIAKQIGCDAAQGYHFAKPLSEKDAESWYLDHS
jgi:EAL domain-containing protein (putative c-di-GMP-specific phosphodiesterase class I)